MADLDTARANVSDLIERVDFTSRRFEDRDDSDEMKLIFECLSLLLRREAGRG